MADYNAGDVFATLRINATEWQRGLSQAQQQLQQFAQAVQRSLASVTPRVDTTAFQQGLRQAEQQLTAFAQTMQRSLASVTPQVDTTAFQQGLRQAEQQLTTFAQQLQRSLVSVQPRIDVTALQQGLQQAQQQISQLRQTQTSSQQQAQQAAQQTAQAQTQAARQTGQAQAQAARATLQAQVQAGREALQAAQQTWQAQVQAARQAGQAQAQAARQALQEQVQAGREALQAAQQRFQAETQAARQAFQAQQQAAGHAGSAFQAALSVAGGLGIATSIGAIVSQMVAFGQSVVTVGANLQQLRVSLNAITGGAQQGGQAFTFVTDTANRAGLSLTTLTQSYRSLAAATRGTALEGAETQRLFSAVTNASKTLGLTTEQTGRAFTAFQQIISKGRVSQEELRQQLGEAIPGALQIAARALGVSTQALDDLVKKGLDSIEFTRRFTTQLQTEFPEGAKGVQTAANAFNALNNEILLLKESIARSGLLEFLANAAAWAAKLLETLRKADEQRATYLKGQATAGLTPGAIEGATPAEQKRLDALAAQLDTARDELKGLQAAKTTGAFGLLTGLIATPAQLEQAQKTVTALEAEDRALRQTLRTREEARKKGQQVIAPRLDIEGGAPGEPDALRLQQQREAEAARANAQLQEQIKTTASNLDVLNAKSKVTPEVFGKLTGTAEQKIKLVNEQIKILEEGLEKTTEAIIARPTGTGAPPPELVAQQTAQREQLTAAEAHKKAIEDAEAARTKAERENEQARLKAIRDGIAERKRLREAEIADREQAIAKEISLTQDLARVQAFIAGPSDNAAKQAQDRVRATGAAIQESIDKALLAFERSAALRELFPGLQQQFQAAKEGLQAAIDTQGLQAFNDALQRNAIEPLENLREKIELTKEQRDLLTVAEIRAKYVGNALVQAQADLSQQSIETRIAYKEEVEALKERFTALKQNADAMREVEEAQERLSKQIRQASMALLPEPETRRASTRLRREAALEGTPLTPELEAQLEALDKLEAQYDRVRYAAELWTDLASGVGNAWGNALQSIADGTSTVSEAFKEMGRSILQTMAQIAQQEATRAFIRLGLNLLTGAATSGLTTTAPAEGAGGAATGTLVGGVLGGGGAQPGGGAPFSFGSMLGGGGGGAGTVPLFGLQHGGIVNRPTRALIGERGPEAIFNKSQMQALFQLTPSAGGQAAGGSPVTIINVATKAQAEQEAASQRAMGREVIINEVLSELSKGESSSINRMIRTLAR